MLLAKGAEKANKQMTAPGTFTHASQLNKERKPTVPISKMAHEIDWLNSQAGLCKVDLYNRDGPKDQNCEVVCFVDVSSLSKGKDQKAKKAGSHASMDSVPSSELDLALENLEEKDIIVIKDNERSNEINTVCLFKQGSSEESNVVNWLSNDLQKYATGFQQALSNQSVPQQPKAFHSSAADKIYQNTNSFQSSNNTNLLRMPEFGRHSISMSKP